MNRVAALLIDILLIFPLSASPYCIFQPPKNWEIAQPKVPTPYVQIGFLGEAKNGFRSCLNLAIEEQVDVSLKQYVKAVKKLQTKDHKKKWLDLGALSMVAGPGHLIEMTEESPWGELKILQAFYVQNKTAYILTASLLKEDYIGFQKEIVSAFKTFQLTDTLWTPIVDAIQRDHFRTLYSSLGTSESEVEWQTFQKAVADLNDLGPYWQFQALQSGKEKIYPEEKK